jgi:PAS domain S-box-containing protein
MNLADQLAAAHHNAAALCKQAAQPGTRAYDLHPALEALTRGLVDSQDTARELRSQLEEFRRRLMAVEAERQRYKALFEFAPDGYLITDPRGIIQEANWAAGILLNDAEEALIGQSLLRYVPAEEIAALEREISSLANLDGVREWEIRLQPRDCTPLDASIAVSPDRDHTGHVVGLRWLIRDITSRRQAAEQLQRLMAELEQRVHDRTAQLEAANRELLNEIEQRKRAQAQIAYQAHLLDNVHDAVIATDAQRRLTAWNRAAETLYGWRASQVLGRPIADVLRPYAAENPQPGLADTLAATGRGRQEVVHFRRDGQPVHIGETIMALRSDSGEVTGYVSVNRDITDRKRAAEALRESQARLSAIIDSAMDAIISVDSQLNIVLFNAAAEHMFRCSAASTLGKPIDRFVPNLFRGTHLEHIRRFGETGVTSRRMGHLGALTGMRADGEQFPFEASISQTQAFGDRFYTVILRDITDRMRDEAQIRALNARLEQRVAERTAELEAKNRELETFTYSVSHDLKAPLRGIAGYTRLLLDDHAGCLDADAGSMLGNIRGAVRHMNQLIDDLLAYSRLEQQRLSTGPVDLLSLINMVIDERSQELNDRGIEVTVDIRCGIAMADADGLTQAMRNLLDNALKFTCTVPEPHIEIRGTEAGDHCTLSIRDNGIGFDIKHHDRIFGIFQRLHRAEDYPGTGIGLAIVHKAMRRMNGHVWAESAAGQGACFHLEIPK